MNAFVRANRSGRFLAVQQTDRVVPGAGCVYDHLRVNVEGLARHAVAHGQAADTPLGLQQRLHFRVVKRQRAMCIRGSNSCERHARVGRRTRGFGERDRVGRPSGRQLHARELQARLRHEPFLLEHAL